MRIILIILTLVTLNACHDPQARKPISVTSGSFKESVERNKALNKAEYKLIADYIAKDSSNVYQQSKSGFWYSYILKNDTLSKKAKFGDIVKYKYNVLTLKNDTIYKYSQQKKQYYAIDKEEHFSGMREALKLLNTGEKGKFIFPSQKAYGYYGDENKIKTNIPLVCNIELIEIKQLTKNETKNKND